MSRIKLDWQEEKFKIAIIVILLVICCFLTYYFHIGLKSGMLFSYFFYIPIVLASLWWRRKGVSVAIFLTLLMVISHNLLREGALTYNDYIRALMFIAISGIVAVLSERIAESEEELWETGEYLDNLLNYANAQIIVWNPEFRITRFNHAFENLTCHTANEVIGKELHMLFPEESRDDSLHDIRLTLKGEYWESVEIPILCRDGNIRIVLWNSANIYAEDGTTLLAVIAQGTDITERRRAEEELRETSEYLDNLLNYANAPIIVWNPGFRITRFNHAFEHLTCYTANEVIGQELHMLFPETSRDDSLHKIRLTLKGEYWESVEIPILCRDGNIRIVFWNSANIYAKDGATILAVIAQGTDITERKRAEEELRKYRNYLEELVKQRTVELQEEITERKLAEEDLKRTVEDLERSNYELEQFAYVASHDLQEPLHKIQSFSDLLMKKHAHVIDDEGLGFLERMHGAANRMQEMINDLLLLSRVTTQAKPFKSVDLEEIIRDVLSDNELLIRKTGAAVDIGNLPTIEADPAQMNQLLSNIINNALKYHREGVIPVIRVYSKPLQGIEGHTVVEEELDRAGYCRIFIEDNGIGFKEEYIDRIFKPFERLHGRSSYEGEGIGLAICKKIVERHGGTIRAESTPGRGSTFMVDLPVSRIK